MAEQRYADLHIHTTASDGTFSPSRVVDLAKEKGFAAIGITDHDAVSGIDEAIDRGRQTGVEIIPGVELSTEYHNKEIHILGYFLDWHDEELNRLIQEFRDYRVRRMEKMLSVLRDLGCNLDGEALMKESEEGAVGRVHLAKAMLNAGFVSSLDEAFDKYLADGRPAYMKKAKLAPGEACDLIKRTGGIPVLAHPHLTKRDDWIPEFIKAGIEGIEAYYSFIGVDEIERYCRMARDNGLLITGGSDCHQSDTKHLLGTVKLPYHHVKELSEYSGEKRGM